MQEWIHRAKKSGKDKMGQNMEGLCDTYLSLGFTLDIIESLYNFNRFWVVFRLTILVAIKFMEKNFKNRMLNSVKHQKVVS